MKIDNLIMGVLYRVEYRFRDDYRTAYITVPLTHDRNFDDCYQALNQKMVTLSKNQIEKIEHIGDVLIDNKTWQIKTTSTK